MLNNNFIRELMVFYRDFFFILSAHFKLSFFKINLRSLLSQEIVLKFFIHIVNCVCLHVDIFAV